MKIVTTLLISSYLLQAVAAKEYRLFERGLCLDTKNGYWTSTERFEASDVFDLSEFQFRTYNGSQCMDGSSEAEERNDSNATIEQIKTRALGSSPQNTNGAQFIQILFFKRRPDVTEEQMIGEESINGLCCTENAIQQGACGSDDAGKLILDRNLFDGLERWIPVPSGDETFGLDELIHIQEDGQYTLLFANCQEGGLNVQLLADPNAGSRHRLSYLGFILFYAFLAVYTASLFISYGRSLIAQKRETRHPMQRYLFVIMLIAFDDFAFRAYAFRALDAGPGWVWSKLFIYTAVAFPVLKRGMSMCLGVLVAKGWGIIEQNVTRSLAQIINLGVVYTGLVAFRDYMSVQAFGLLVPLDGDSDLPLFSNVAAIVTVIVHVMDIMIAIWIVHELHGTIRQLRQRAEEEENQQSPEVVGETLPMNQQLKNYLRLRQLILVSMTIALPWRIIRLLARIWGTMVFTKEYHTFIVAAIIQLVYIVLLTSVSILWRPSSSPSTARNEQDAEKPGARRTEDESTQQETSTLLF